MTLADDILRSLVVEPGAAANLADRDPAWKGGQQFEDMATDDLKSFAKDRLQASDSQVGFLYSAGSLGVVVLSLAAGPLRKRWTAEARSALRRK